MAQRHCDICGNWHDLNEPWPNECMGHYRKDKTGKSSQVMGDLEPYKSMITGEVIQGRKQHRDHLKAHGKIEIGNEYESASKRERKEMPPIEQTVKRAFDAYEQGYRPRPMTRREFDS